MRSKDTELMNRIHEYLNQYIIENHHTPTQKEVAMAMNISPTTAHRYLTEMGKKGMISYDHKVVGTEVSEKCSSDYIVVPIVGSIKC